MATIRCNHCKHYDRCEDVGAVWWVDCPWWDGDVPPKKDKLQEYADKLTRGCSCDNCYLVGTESCDGCLHLENWDGWLEI